MTVLGLTEEWVRDRGQVMSMGRLGLLSGDLDVEVGGARLRAPRPDWRGRSACGDMGPDAFATDRVLRDDEEREAKKVCAGCVVQEECLAFALAHAVRNGVWGGFNHDERRQLRRAWLEQRAASSVSPN